jgi:hypothetical protein
MHASSALVATLLLSACGGSTSGDSATTSGSATVAQCGWPASLSPPPDAGPWTWKVGRYFLSCNDGTAFEDCVSNDPSTCPGPNAIAGATLSNCTDQCGANEYVVAAGGPPQPSPDGGFTMPPTPDLPTSCRFLSANPAGVSYSCCTCQ